VITGQTLICDDACASRFICGLEPFQPGIRMVRPGAYRFASAGFLLYLLPLPIPYDRRQKAACLLQTRLRISPAALPLFPIPEQFSPAVGDNLQILPNRPLLRTF